MFHHQEVHDPVSHPDGTRPPQLNQTVCGCRCGRGTGGVQESERDDEGVDGLSTIVASDDSDMEEYVSCSGDTELNTTIEGPVPDPEYLAYVRARVEHFVNTTEGALHVSGVDLPSHFPDQNVIFSDHDADSMRPEPSSDAHSVVTSDSRSIRPMSPGPGIGYWTHEDAEYYFRARPLRLTPQHQYCRGLVASHLVMRDQEVVMAPDNGFRVDGHLQEV